MPVDLTPLSRREAMLAPLAALPFILVRPKLLLLALTPLLINFFLFLGVASLLTFYVGPQISEWIFPGTGVTSGILRSISDLALTAALLIGSAFLAFILISPVSAPFNDLISERVERELLRDHPELIVEGLPWTHNMRHAALDTLERLFITLPIFLITFTVGIIPFCGPPTAAVIGFCNAMFFLAVDAYSYSLDRRGVKLRGKFGYLNQRRPVWVGLGTGLALFLLIPCNILFLPMLGAVAGTRLYCREVLRTKMLAQGR
jgi:CysZ protein